MPGRRVRTGGKKKVAFRAASRHLETTVHTSLPPRVQGPLRAYVRVCVSAIMWEYSIGPPASKLCVALKWWGEESPGTVFRVPVLCHNKRQLVEESTTLAYYPVRAALPQLKAYLTDMKALKLLVGLGHMTEESMVIGRCTLPDLSALSETQPYDDSIPIISSKGHALGRLHVQMEIQVAKAGLTRLMAPTEDTTELGFKVGPGATIIAKRRELHELKMEERSDRPQQKSSFQNCPINAPDLHQSASPSSQTIASHKAALLAKYVQRRTEPSSTHFEGRTEELPPNDKPQMMALGPQQREVISELIERGEKLRNAMVLSVLKSGKDQRVRSAKEPQTIKTQQDHCEVYSSEDENEKEEFSMDESDYPLHNPSLLEQLLYCNYGQKTAESKTMMVDSEVQTHLHSPSPPVSPVATAKSVSTNSHHSSHPSSPLPTPSHPHKQDANQQTATSGSLTTLSSFFSGQSLQKSLDEEILQAVGMERLTQLGTVTSSRVVVEKLVIEQEKLAAVISRSVKTRLQPRSVPTTQRRGTFFVEYHFPAPLARGGRLRGRGRGRASGRGITAARSFPPPHEVVRVASKKINNGVVHFGHRSVFPVSLVGHTTRQWWHDMLVFSIYYRPPTDRSPLLLGKARVPFRQWLMAQSSSRVEVDVMSSAIDRRGTDIKETETEDGTERTLGKLTVSMHLLCGRNENHELPCGDVAASVSERELERETEREIREHRDERSEGEKWSHAPPIRVKTTHTLTTKDIGKQPSALQLLLIIPEGRDLSLPTPNANKPSLSPNCYLVCRLFCADPHPKTTTVWATSNPHFNFKQVFSLFLTPSLLEQVCNNFTVVEVWHKTPGTNTSDELLGLVKLSLHQFYLAFSDDSSSSLCLGAELPVVAVDSYCPVVSPFTGNEQGSLAVLLALGSVQQITVIQQQFAAGAYVLHQPFSKSQTAPYQLTTDQQTQIGRPSEAGCVQDLGPVQHMFDVTVNGIRGLSVFNNTVWGEADCYVQYHFPYVAEQQSQEDDGDEEGERGPGSEVSLQPFRTDMTLCVPNPSFTHETRHTLVLPLAHPVQRAVMMACGSSGTIPFELWRRFYYPNIRDQLIAKASLPMAKLCALVSMQRMAGPTVQSFSLPFQLVTQEIQGGSGGILEVTVQYQALQDGQQQLIPVDSQKKTHTILSVAVLRATGLKDAAVLAAQEQPVPLGFAAEVGTNNYAKISFPDLLDREKRNTKTVTRSFSPDFSHSFDFALPLVSRESIHPYTVTVPLAQKLAECSAVIEIWHKIPKNDTHPAPIAGKVFGRRLAPAFKDVCLGQTIIPLIKLLEKQTGVHGWFPLFPPLRNSDTQGFAPGPINNLAPGSVNPCVGGVEMSLSFSNKEDRKLILGRGLEMGWKIPESCMVTTEGLDEIMESFQGGQSKTHDSLRSEIRWKFCLKMTELWVPLEAVTIPMSEDPAPYLYCFLRYRFFDSDVVVSPPRALSYCSEGRGCYQLNHQVKVTLTGSHDLEWYVREESVEVEVWSCPTRRRQREGTNDVPDSDDSYLGTACIPLQSLCSKETISGCYPVFKAGEASLGNQLLMMEVHKSAIESPEPQSDAENLNTVLEILETPDDDFIPLQPVSEGELTAELDSEGTNGPVQTEEEDNTEKFKDMFEARLVIHQALHLPMMTDKIQQKEWPPSAYVTFHPHPRVDRIVTEAIPDSQTPFWNHQCLTHLPNLYLDPHCPGLEFQVWSKVASDCTADDIYIGCAHIDLSTLTFGLPQISGWYNITDFGGQIQGQMKVSIVPSQRLSFPSGVSSCPLPCSHVVLPTPSTFSQLATDPAIELVPQSSDCDHVKPAPSFMDKTSSVLFKKLRDDLSELEQINSSLKAKVTISTVPSDVTSFSSHLPMHIPTLLSTSNDISTTTTTTTTMATVLLDYSSSGPTLEHHSHKDDISHDGKETEVVKVLTEAEVVVESGDTVSSPERDPVEPSEMRSEGNGDNEEQEMDVNSQCGTPPDVSLDIQPSSTPEDVVTATLPRAAQVSETPGVLQKHSRSPSSTSSLDVEVDALLPTALNVSSSGEDSPSHSLTNVSTNSSYSDLSPSPPLQRVAENQCTIADNTASKTVLKRGRGEKGEVVSEGADHSKAEGSGEHLTVRTSEPQSVALHSSCGGNLTSVMTGTTCQEPHAHVDTKVDGSETGLTPIATAEDSESIELSHLHTDLPSTSSHSTRKKLPATGLPHASATSDQLKLQPSSSIQQMPEISLPNFFMPPRELEQTMRSLRASALSRPPPRTLFGDHTPPHTQPIDSHESHSASSLQQPGQVRTLQDVNEFLKSRRAGRDVQIQAGHYQEISTKHAQRLSRIFTSKPLPSYSEHK